MRSFVSATVIVALSGLCAGGATTRPGATQLASVSLKISSRIKSVPSGYPLPLDIGFKNDSSLPFCFSWRFPPCDIFGCDVLRTEIQSKPEPTAEAKRRLGLVQCMRTLYNKKVLRPGTSCRYGAPYPVTLLHDLTLPGEYHIRLVTQGDILLISRPGTYLTTRRSGSEVIGKRFYMPNTREQSFNDRFPGAQRLAKLQSNTLTFVVQHPYSHVPPDALASVTTPPPNSGSGKAQKLSFETLPPSGPRPILLNVYLRTGKKPARFRLTGNPLIDFAGTQVAGPDGVNGDHLITKPKPHYGPIPNWKAVPLTAYGKWLSKHKLSLNDKEKDYTLKPGVLYKYAVSVNLPCQFDMSIPGVYHVRLKLAGTSVKSAWEDVRIPFP